MCVYKEVSSLLADHDLVAQAQAGDMAAFEQLVKEHQGPLYRYLCRMSRNASDAEEMMQETFIKAWQSIRGFRGQASFKTWLFRIAANLCINRLTRRRPTVELLESAPADPSAEPEEVFRRKVRQAAIEAALVRLPVDQRSAVLLLVYDEMTYEEIADAMGRSLASVNALLYRARMALRGYLADARGKGLL